MKYELKIPFNDKDIAKDIAIKNNCILYFDSSTKLWICDTKNSDLPNKLSQYVVSSNNFNNFNNDNKIVSSYKYVLDIPYMQKDLVKIYGVKYDVTYKTNIIETQQLNDDLTIYKTKPYSYEAYIEKQINNNLERQEIKEQYCKKQEIIPRDYQTIAYKTILNTIKNNISGFLLADEVGLGKTISSCLIVQEKQFEKILIVTTLSAIPHWRNTLLKMLLPNKEIIVINYDRLQKLFDVDQSKLKNIKKRKTKSKMIAKIGTVPEFDLIIFDESHKLKNNTTNRFKFAMKLIENCDFTLYMSATAGQNPLELGYLSHLLAEITNQPLKNFNDFEKWCQSMNLGVERGAFGKWIWNGDKQTIERIHNLLFKNNIQVALRRTPVDIAGYPEINRILLPIEMTLENQKNYQLFWNIFKKEIVDNENHKTSKKYHENKLVQQLRFRQKASYLKIPQTVEMTLDLLENQQKVAISVAFKETLFEIKNQLEKEKINVCVIYGDLKPNEKEMERLKFQKDPKYTVCLFTVTEAISLHQNEYLDIDIPRSLLIHDIRWSAIENSQIEGRCHRDGKFAQVYWLFLENTIEKNIAKILMNKTITMKNMIGDDTKTLEEIDNLFFNIR